MDAGERKAQMAVLAETTSPEDYEKCRRMAFRWMIPRAIRS